MFLGTLVRDVRRALRRLFIFGAAVALLGTAANQVITRGFIYSNIGTLFSWSGSAPAWSGSNQAATYNDFTTYVKNNGSCVPAGLTNVALIDYSHATGCAVNTTTVNATTDPWLINGATSWTQSGGSFAVLGTGAISGQPAGAQYFQATAASNTSAIITQTIVPNVVAGTKLVARAYVLRTSESANDSSQCGTGGQTVTGGASVEIKDPSGTVVAHADAASGSWTQVVAILTSAATSGTYKIVGYVADSYQAGASYESYNPTTQTCMPKTKNIDGYGEITDLAIGNS